MFTNKMDFRQIGVYFTLLFVQKSPQVYGQDNCSILRNELADAITKFSWCSLEYSRPVNLCINCVDDFITIHESYLNFSKSTECLNRYVNQDRLGVLETVYMNSVHLWNRGKCYECFETVDGKLTNNQTKKTEEFFKLYDIAKLCFNAQENKSKCIECQQYYKDLDNFYLEISNINENIGACMDIVDLMNNTRLVWSETCCEFRKKDETIFFISSAVVILITMIFYVLAKYCTEKTSPTIVQQPRFAEALNSHST